MRKIRLTNKEKFTIISVFRLPKKIRRNMSENNDCFQYFSPYARKILKDIINDTNNDDPVVKAIKAW